MTDVTERWRTERVTAAVYDAGVKHDRVAIVGARAMWGADMRRMFAEIERLADAPVGASVLDIPCGGGFAFRGLRPSQPVRYVAADISPYMLQLARREANRREVHDAIEFIEADMTALRFDDLERSGVNVIGMEFADPAEAGSPAPVLADDEVTLVGIAERLRANPGTKDYNALSVLVQNAPGVLARVIGLFSGRGYNIESLTVSETESQKHLSRITIVTTGTPMVIEQIKHQLDRMVPVYRVVDMTLLSGRAIERELAMVKVRGVGEHRVEALRLADAFRARVIDATTESFVFEITGNTSKINQFIDLMRPLGLVEVSRTGVAAIGRGPEGM